MQFGATAIHLAAENGHDVILSYLFSAECPYARNWLNLVDAKDSVRFFYYVTIMKHGFTALHLAAQRGHLLSVETLLKNHADVSAVESRGLSVLSIAILSSFTDIVAVLLQANAEVFCMDLDGGSPLSYACCCKSDDILKLILKSLTNQDFGNEGRVNLDVPNRIRIKHGIKSVGNQSNRMTLLHLAAVEGSVATVSLLLKFADLLGIDIEATTLVIFFMSMCYIQVDAMTAFHLACDSNMRIHFKIGVAPTGAAIRLREVRYRAEALAIISALVPYSNINAIMKNGSTALHLASEKGDEAVVNLLLHHGASTKIVNAAGLIAQDVAFDEKMREIFQSAASIELVEEN